MSVVYAFLIFFNASRLNFKALRLSSVYISPSDTSFSALSIISSIVSEADVFLIVKSSAYFAPV